MIQVENLVFEYPGVRALDGVSFTVAPGSITALVGPNGAGKTTLLRCLAALDAPLSGRALIDGIDVQEEPRACHARVGYLSDFYGLYQTLTVRQCLTHVALSQRLSNQEAARAVEHTAAQVGLHDKLDIRAGELSRGQRQRVAIGQAIIHRPRVVLLDEPASGLDPEARHALAELFLALRDQGMTLLVSSHILAELEEYSTAMLVLREGRIVEHADIQPRHQRTRLRIRLATPPPEAFDWKAIPGLEVLGLEAGEITCTFDGDEAGRHELLKQLLAGGLAVYGFDEERVNLQDAYLATVKRTS
jgi:ABC-2 type transport system ATP-binding protein